MGQAEFPELRLRSTPWGLLRFILPICLVVSLFVWRRALTPDHRLTATGWFVVAAMAVFLCSMVRPLFQPSTLTLDPEGFTLRGGANRKKPKTLWKEILEIGPSRAPYFGADRIGYNYRIGFGPYDSETPTSIRRTLGYDGIIPNTFGLSSQNLLETFQRYFDASEIAMHQADADKEPWEF